MKNTILATWNTQKAAVGTVQSSCSIIVNHNNDISDAYRNGEIYYVARADDAGNAIPKANPLSREPDEDIVDLSKSPKYVYPNRPAVIIGTDHRYEDSVLAVFLVKRSSSEASSDEAIVEWYKNFSPRQENIKLQGSFSTALCSHVVRVNLRNLFERKGTATQDDLNRIVDQIRKSGEFNDILPFLYQPIEEEKTV